VILRPQEFNHETPAIPVGVYCWSEKRTSREITDCFEEVKPEWVEH
jgi:hypothetical protein